MEQGDDRGKSAETADQIGLGEMVHNNPWVTCDNHYLRVFNTI
jgi:hypothetical protein